ncbi:MAG TPA: class I adenylate-forming enzyme family protein [Mycobacteriales bacterium]|nr:class I adenylate-forming enzyme family protein [Mycobacteriales bacterium]
MELIAIPDTARRPAGAPARPAGPEKASSLISSLLHPADPVIATRPAVVPLPMGSGSVRTYGDLDADSARVRSWLMAHGVHAGDRVALVAPASAGWLAAWLGILRAGAVVVPLDPGLTQEELATLLRRSGVVAVLLAGSAQETARASLGDLGEDPAVLLVEDIEALPVGDDADSARAPHDVALLVWTSGTTGAAKGVCLTYANVDYVVSELVAAQDINADDRWLTVLPLHHMLALCGVLAGLRVGAPLHVVTSLMPHELVAAVAEHGLTRMMVVPLLLRILEADLARSPEAAGSLRSLFCGGAQIRTELLESYAGLGIEVIQGYGLTEFAPTATMNTPADNRLGSVGRPLPGTELRLHEGEIWLRGPGMMAGYLQEDGTTTPPTADDGWFHTGDLGRLDDDGFLYVVGRAKNIIVLESGKKVQPEEIEDVLGQSSLLAEVCVIPIVLPTGRQAGLEQVCAVVVPSYEARATYADPDSLVEAMRIEVAALTQGLSGYKRPTFVVIRDAELPKTAKRSVRRDAVVRETRERLTG